MATLKPLKVRASESGKTEFTQTKHINQQNYSTENIALLVMVFETGATLRTFMELPCFGNMSAAHDIVFIMF